MARKARRPIFVLILVNGVGAAIAAVLTALTIGANGDLGRVGATLMIAGASSAGGFILGVLFGIPGGGESADTRSSVIPSSSDNKKLKTRRNKNTNLESASDWLTKILIGFGLIQLGNTPDLLLALRELGSRTIAPGAVGEAIGVSIVLFQSVSGFLLGYQYVRTELLTLPFRAHVVNTADDSASSGSSTLGKIPQTKVQDEPPALITGRPTTRIGYDGLGEIPIRQIKRHIVQIEAMILYVIGINVTLFYIAHFIDSLGAVAIIAPLALLTGLPGIVRVTNPENPMRDRLNWGLAVGGFLGTLAGAVTDILSGGLTLGQGTLLGGTAGATIGGAAGPTIERWRKRNDLLERGDAFAYLYSQRKRSTYVSNPNQISRALDESIPSFDINEDGRRWFLADHLRYFTKYGKAPPDVS